MTFNDVHKRLAETEPPCDFDAGHGMFDPVGPRPAYIMEQAALPHQFPVNGNLQPLCKGQRCPGHDRTVRHDFTGTTGNNKEFYIRSMHNTLNNTTLRTNFNNFGR
jgi:hypothetical protein